MSCSYPLEGFRSHSGTWTPMEKGSTGVPLTIPCGNCMRCRIKTSVDWAVRCTNEMQMHKENCFITLTYSKENYPKNGSLNHKHYQDFMKRLRFNTGIKIRMFMAGEYGQNNDDRVYGHSELGRPHFHAILFGYFPFDAKLFQERKQGEKYYTSEELSRAWGHGFVVVTQANYQTAAYISRYVTKKIKGDLAPDYYQRVDIETGEVVTLSPEYNKQSNRPGIGRDWLDTYLNDVFPSDEIIIKGKTHQPPRYYTKVLKDVNPDLYEDVEQRRKESAFKNKQSSTDARDYWQKAADSEKYAQQQLLKNKRIYENT